MNCESKKMNCTGYDANNEKCKACIQRPDTLKILDEIDLCADCEHGIVARWEIENKFVHIIGCKMNDCEKAKTEKELDNCINCPNSETIQFNSERVNYTAIRCKKRMCFEQLNF